MTEAIVLGGGMVGVSTALSLQARGMDVVLLDRRAPGQETSFGNAGIIQSEAAEPYGIPRDLKTLVRYGLGLSNDVAYDVRGALRMLPALARYFRFSNPSSHAVISATYSRLIAQVLDHHAPLIRAAGTDNLIRKDGYLLAFRSIKELDDAEADARRLAQAYGIQHRLLDSKALADEEPSLIRPMAGAIHWPGPWSCSDPGALVQSYADLFCKRGGKLISGEATTLSQTSTGWQIISEEGPVVAEHAVVALGPWSPEFLKPLGYHVMMVRKRGYHRHFKTETRLNRPLLDAGSSVVLSSMTNGLRMTSGAALVDQDAPSHPTQLARAERNVRQILSLGQATEHPVWFGHRPCMPDMLPVVGKAPKHHGLWFNFGHGHQGFTLGPTTGELLADAMSSFDNPLLSALAPAARTAVIKS